MNRFIAGFGVGIASFIVMATILLLGGIEYKQALTLSLGFGIAVGAFSQ